MKAIHLLQEEWKAVGLSPKAEIWGVGYNADPGTI